MTQPDLSAIPAEYRPEYHVSPDGEHVLVCRVPVPRPDTSGLVDVQLLKLRAVPADLTPLPALVGEVMVRRMVEHLIPSVLNGS